MSRKFQRGGLELLPETSFIKFEAARVRAPRVLWRNASFPQIDPFDYSYCNPCPGESEGDYVDEHVELLAERYGGAGLADNGGGVRCGILADVQIKGCGANPLAGVATDYWHKHGAMSVQDAIKESFWGELLHQALPFGAARAYGIVSTASRFATEAGELKTRSSVARALMLREAVVRPAHFMRAIFFRPAAGSRNLVSDLERTRAALQHLPHVSAILSEGSDEGVIDIPNALEVIFQRAAAQLAAARAKRLHHGSLTPSNIGIDGRWLDFGTLTGLDCYRRVVSAPGAVEFWNQEVSLLEAIYDLTFYVSKFLNVGLGHAALSARVARTFVDALELAQQSEFIQLTGVSRELLKKSPASVSRPLWNAMSEALKLERGSTVLYFGDDRHPIPASAQPWTLREVLRCCALSKSADALDEQLHNLLVPRFLSSRLSHAYWNMRRYCVQASESSSCADLAFALRGLRLNGSREALHRRRLDGEIDALSKGPLELVGPELQAMIERWSPVLSNDDAVSLAPWFADDKSLQVTPSLDIKGNGQSVRSPAELEQLIRGSKLPPSEVSRLIHAQMALV